MSNKRVIKNPLLDDFTVEYDKHGDNPKKFTIPAGEIKEIEEPYAKHVIKHLYNEVINSRNLNGIALNADPEEKKKIMDEIDLDI